MMTRRIGTWLNGPRGQFLFCFGLIYVAIGLSYLVADSASLVRRQLSWVDHIPWVALPLVEIFGVAWAAAGIVGVLCSHLSAGRDRAAFAAMSGVVWGWAIVNLVSWVLGTSPRGWVSMFVFAALGVAMQIAARGMVGATPEAGRASPAGDVSGPP